MRQRRLHPSCNGGETHQAKSGRPLVITTFCNTCQETVHVEDDVTPFCPSPLVKTAEEAPESSSTKDYSAG